MATPEEIASQPETQSLELRLIPGGLAVEQSVEVRPAVPPPFSEIRASLNESDWNAMTHEQLQEIWDTVSAYRKVNSYFMHHLSQEDREALEVMHWIQGLQRDRPPQ